MTGWHLLLVPYLLAANSLEMKCGNMVTDQVLPNPYQGVEVDLQAVFFVRNRAAAARSQLGLSAAAALR